VWGGGVWDEDVWDGAIWDGGVWGRGVWDGGLWDEGDEVGQARPALHEPVLARRDPPVVLHMLYDLPQDDLLHNLFQHGGQACVPWILLTVQ